eukprot:5877324-Pyramimonas_sp.AAC.1
MHRSPFREECDGPQATGAALVTPPEECPPAASLIVAPPRRLITSSLFGRWTEDVPLLPVGALPACAASADQASVSVPLECSGQH